LLARAGLALVLAVLSGCGKAEPYLAVARAQVRAQEELADLLATIQDRASMEAARPALREHFKRFEDIQEKARALPPRPPAGVNEQLQEELSERMQAVVRRLAQESARIGQLPGGPEFLKELAGLK
jgi:hypothetical protein